MSEHEQPAAGDWAAWEETVRRAGGAFAATGEDAITSRHSVRAFLPDPVPRFVIERVLRVAGQAPSGSNIQPWHTTVVTGAALERLRATLTDAFLAGPEPDWPFHYYPRRFGERYLARRRACGWGLYGTLGIAKGDAGPMRRQHARNFRFFDAPMALFFTLDRELEIGSWLDMGMYIQSVMVAARAVGLHSCPQAAFVPYHQPIRAHLGIPDDRIVVCGMSIGLEDRAAPENAFVPDRAPLDECVRFVDG